MAIPSEFWSTSAQTLPVLALAQILEARAIIARWGATKWNGIQRVMVGLWIAPLVAYAWTTPICFNALRGIEPGKYWPQVIVWAINIGMGILVLSPALNLFMVANARPIARLATTHPIAMMKASRSTRHLMQKNEEQRQRVKELISRVLKNLNELEDLIKGASDLGELPESLTDKAAEIRAEGAAIIADLEKMLAEIETASTKTGRLTAESVQLRKDALDRTEIALRASFMALDGGLSGAANRGEPDPPKNHLEA
jgi:hypothetical protein